MNYVIYTFHIATILSMLLSGVFIASVRGSKPPLIYLQLYWFVSIFLCIVNIFQTLHTPVYGQALWNPLHLLMLLAVYPFLFAYIFGMLRPGSIGVRFWLSAYLPLTTLATLYFGFDALFGKLPLFSNYAELRNYLNLPQLWVLFAAAAFSIVLISHYTVRAVGMMRYHKRNFESNFSCTEGNTLEWMWWAIAITLFKCLLVLTRIMTGGSAVSLTVVIFFSIEPVIITALVLRQKDLYGLSTPKDKKLELRNGNSELSSEKQNFLKQKLLLLLEKDEVFKNPDLDSAQLSEMMQTNRTYLSLIINQGMNTTFFDLINNYRLNKSVEMMRDPLRQDMNLSAIAEICGFKNLTAFGRYFKKIYGKSPTEWRKETFPDENSPE
ncbi:MAG: helix-turn-helix domain-containing protein [Tannerella sp.]|nr:helix-turn-helix domain-containing protein [Tannerella sp.]